MELKTFVYSLVRFVPDVVRGERVNLGVVVVSDEDRDSAARFLSSFGPRVTMLDPGCDPSGLERVLETLRARFCSAQRSSLYASADERIVSKAGLQNLADILTNELQLSKPRMYRSATLNSAVDELFSDLVMPPGHASQPSAHMTVEKVRELVRDTISSWSGGDDQQQSSKDRAS